MFTKFLVTARCTIDDIPLAVRGSRDSAERFAAEFIAKLGDDREIDAAAFGDKLDFDPSEFIGCGIAEFDEWGDLVSYRYHSDSPGFDIPPEVAAEFNDRAARLDAAAVDAAMEVTEEDRQLLQDLEGDDAAGLGPLADTPSQVVSGNAAMTPDEIVAHYKANRARIEAQREKSINSGRLGRQLAAFNLMNQGKPFNRADLFLETSGEGEMKELSVLMYRRERLKAAAKEGQRPTL